MIEQSIIQYLIPLFFVLSRASQEFHLHLNGEELSHYFGTTIVNTVPDYTLVSPTSVTQNILDRRDVGLSKEYILNVFGVDYHLYLLPYRELISSACITQRIRSNDTHLLEPCIQGDEFCHYHGYIKNHNQSAAAISTCDGLHGIVSLTDNEFVIQPVRRHHQNLTSQSHIIYKQSIRKLSSQIHDAGNHETDTVSYQFQTKKRRSKRSAGRYLELKVVVAPDAAKVHGSDTQRFVTTVLNVAAMRYLDSSLGNEIYLTLVEMLILENDQEGLSIVKNSENLLSNFCQWQKRFHPEDDSDPRHADQVLLITKTDLEAGGDDVNVGMAYRGQTCSRGSKCSVAEDTGLDLGLTIAHEIGHSLGMNHDGEGNTCQDGKFIMAKSGAGGLKWSRCSAKELEDFISSKGHCLNDAPAGSATNLYDIKEKPGMFYSANRQCQLAMDTEEATYCGNEVDCGVLKCHRETHCYKLASPLVDGTECGNRKWCIEGKCVAMGAGSPGPIDGGWSSWSTQWTECSRTCGGGVRTKSRKCNNPEPKFGGQPCTGEGLMAVLCNVQECHTSQYRYKEEQCAATDSEPYNGQTYHWLPYASSSEKYDCELRCRYFGGSIAPKRGSGKYHDGTDCQGHSQIGRCVDGICKDFGCDGHHGSGLAFDKCGVCNGQGNTCQEHRGTYNQGTANQYVTFVTIPQGATGIEITNLNYYCHLSIQVNGRRMFSEDGNQLSSSGTYTSHGVVAKYRKEGPEKIEIVGPVTVSIEAQVWREYGSGYVGTSPEVTFIYHTPLDRTDSAYKWVKTPGACSHSCGTGWSVPDLTCTKVNTHQVVDDFHCNLYSRPTEPKEACNINPCPPSWVSSNWDTCSRSCGGGETHRTVQCMVFHDGSHVPVDESHCRGQNKPQSSRNCNINPCPGVWKAGDWSCCSKTCSRGVKTREVKCYASHGSDQPIDNDNCVANQKPAEQEICMDKPCDTSLSGSSCTDKITDCTLYGSDVCSTHESWAKDNCGEYCGYCVKDPANFKPPTSDNCKDKDHDCASYGAGVCNSHVDWSKVNCQRTCNYCPASSCSSAQAGHTSFDQSAGTCSDKISDCADYGANVCTDYGQWAKDNCQKHCNFCPVQEHKDEDKSTPSCSDKISDCADYGANVCTEYGQWAKDNCQKHCHFCQDVQAVLPATTTTPTPSTGGCVDKISDCADYGANVCTEYGGWAKENCQKHCHYCQEASCKDKSSDCADYGKSACTEYAGWAKENCQSFCNLCGTRKKRSLPFTDAVPEALLKDENLKIHGQEVKPYHLDNPNAIEPMKNVGQNISQKQPNLKPSFAREPMVNNGDSPVLLSGVPVANKYRIPPKPQVQHFSNKESSEPEHYELIPTKKSGKELHKDAFRAYLLAHQTPVDQQTKSENAEGHNLSIKKSEENGFTFIDQKLENGKVPSEDAKSSNNDEISEKDGISDNLVKSREDGTTDNSEAPLEVSMAKDTSNIHDVRQQNYLDSELGEQDEISLPEQNPGTHYPKPSEQTPKPLPTKYVDPVPLGTTDSKTSGILMATEDIPRDEGGHRWIEMPNTDDVAIETDVVYSETDNNQFDNELKVLQDNNMK